MTEPRTPPDSTTGRRLANRVPESQAYASARPPEVSPPTNARNEARAVIRPTPERDRVSSRTTEEEARDLLALRRAKRGDDGAFADLIRDNDTSIRSFVVALVGTDWFDRVVRDTYIRAYRGIDLAPNSSPRIWLIGIADGACRDAIRRWERSGGRDRPDVPPPIPVTLPPEERLIVAAVEGAGLTVREAGRLVTGGAETARAHLDQGRRHLADDLPFAPPPDHGPDFWNDLGHQLIVARSAPAARIVDHGEPIPPTSPSPQAGRAARGMAQRVAERSPRTIPWRHIGLSVMVVATVGVLIAVTLTVAHRAAQRDLALGDTATKVLERVDQSLARNGSVGGTAIVSRSSIDGLPDGRYTVTRSNTGSYRIRAADGSIDEGYDVGTGQFTSIRGGAAGTVQVQDRTAPGPPRWSSPSATTIGDLLAGALRVVHRGSSGTVTSTMVTLPADRSAQGTTTTVPGRPVWVLTAAQPNRSDAAGADLLHRPGIGVLETTPVDRVRLVVDRSLVLPSRLELFRTGRVIVDVRFTDMTIGQQAPADAFLPSLTPGTRVDRSDAGFTPTPAGDLVATGGRDGLTPNYLPDGYVLTAAAVNRSDDTIVLSYRNGSLQLAITSTPAARRSTRTDPFGQSIDGTPGIRSLSIRSGAFAGRPAWEGTTPVDQVWARGPKTEVVVAGDPPPSELVKVIASLQ